MEGIAKIIITNIIVYGAVFGALGIFYRPSKNVDSFTTNRFTVEFSTGVKTIIIFCFLVSVFFMVTNYGNVFGKWKVGTGSGLITCIGFTALFLLLLLCVMLFVVWKIRIEDDNVYYRNYFGITKTYSADEITEVRKKKSGTTVVYKGSHKIFVIDESVKIGNYFFRRWAHEHNIPITEGGKK